jgi:hypothetical protein
VSNTTNDHEREAEPLMASDEGDHLYDMLRQIRTMKFSPDDKNHRHLIYYRNGEQTPHELNGNCWCEPELVDVQENRPPVWRHRRQQ